MNSTFYENKHLYYLESHKNETKKLAYNTLKLLNNCEITFKSIQHDRSND